MKSTCGVCSKLFTCSYNYIYYTYFVDSHGKFTDVTDTYMFLYHYVVCTTVTIVHACIYIERCVCSIRKSIVLNFV